MKRNEQKAKAVGKKISTATRAYLPDSNGRKWHVRFVQRLLERTFEIEIRFPTRTGTFNKIMIPNELRAEFDQIRKQLLSFDADLPEDKGAALSWVQELVRATPNESIFSTYRPGFVNGGTGFVMPNKRYGSASGRFIWDPAAETSFGEISGDLESFKKHVLEPALHSPLLTFGIMIALAAPLASYVQQRQKQRLLSEGAVYYFVADTTTGKTTIARCTAGVIGSPALENDFALTEPGLEGAAYQRNDSVVIIDDTETFSLEDRDLLKKMRMIAGRIARGRSRTVRGAPRMTFSCMAVANGPEALATLARRLGVSRHGNAVRWIELPVPRTEEGGIFGCGLSAATSNADAEELIKQIDGGLEQHHGVLMDAWLEKLCAKDYSGEIVELTEEFVDRFAGSESAPERRWAAKLCVPIAAGVLAQRILRFPWPAEWPVAVSEYCYREARRLRDPDADAITQALLDIAKRFESPQRFIERAGSNLPRETKGAIGVLTKAEDGRRAGFLVPDWLARSNIITARLVDRLIGEAKRRGLLIRSDNQTGSVQIRVLDLDGDEAKVRGWRVDRAKWDSFAREKRAAA